MNKNEARSVIIEQLGPYRERPYSELVGMIDSEVVTREVAAPSGNRYQIEIEVFWDDKPNGDVRVIGCIDDGGLRAYFPLAEAFIKNPSDEFVGE